MKWVLVAVLFIIAILAAFVAVEYFVVSIHSLPSFIPGHRPVNGHYRKRGALAALVAILAVVGGVILAIRFSRESRPAAPQVSAGDMLAGPAQPQSPQPPPAG